MKIKITKQTTWTVEINPVQKSRRSTGEQSPKQSVHINNTNIIAKNK